MTHLEVEAVLGIPDEGMCGIELEIIFWLVQGARNDKTCENNQYDAIQKSRTRMTSARDVTRIYGALDFYSAHWAGSLWTSRMCIFLATSRSQRSGFRNYHVAYFV